MEVAGLEQLVNEYDLILKNEPGKATWPIRKRITLIIDLTSTTADIGALDM